MIFGSEKFEPIVGELDLASKMTSSKGGKEDGSPDDDSTTHPKLKAFRQKKRQVQCAVNLAAKLQQWVDGDEAGFVQQAEADATELSENAFGSVLLQLIGTSYMEHVAEDEGGLGGLNGETGGLEKIS